MSKKNIKKLNIKVDNILFGNNVQIIEPSNLYSCTLGDNVFIGPFVEIQKGVRIGSGTRVQSHSFICELVQIGSNCSIGHGVMFINDTYQDGCPAYGDQTKWKETFISNKVFIGSNATILPVKICSNVVIGAGSVVTKDIELPGIYAGNPARFLKHNPQLK